MSAFHLGRRMADELTNVAIWMAAFGEVNLSTLQDFSQSSRVANVSVSER
jgi:hypothetical protein